MEILFFLEPSIEHGNPFFRYASLRGPIVSQAKNLKKSHKTTLFTSEHLANKLISDGFGDCFNKIVGVNSLDWEQSESSYKRLVRHQKKLIVDSDIEFIRSHFHLLLGRDYTPDVIMVWESPAYFFEKIYDNAMTIHQTPGFFSRPPYPSLVMFDNELLNVNHFKECQHVDIFPEEIESFQHYRDKSLSFLKKVSPLEEHIASVYQKFDYVVLFPLQVDSYFMINSLLDDGITQFDLLVDILKKTPKNVGVWVTNYISKDIQSSVLTESNIDFLKNNFDNFIYINDCDTIPYVSQFITPFIDGVMTISSSVGYQAVFYKKQLYLLGSQNQLTSLCSASSLEQFYKNIEVKKLNEKDDEIIKIIKSKHLPSSFFTGDKYASWLEDVVRDREIKPWSDNVGNSLMALQREEQLLKEVGFFNRSGEVITNDFCNELSTEIKKYDVISFDIFDTLLYRPFKFPSDLFRFIECDVHTLLEDRTIDFHLVRTNAEKEAFKKALLNNKNEISIDDIYDEIAIELGLTSDKKEVLKKLEMDSEMFFLYPRKSGLAAFKEAISSGKTVILISDMYLPASFLEKALHKNGYIGYEKLFVSSSYDAKKHNGKLFDVVLENIVFPASSILHIGDNEIGDIRQAKSRGIATFHLNKAIDLFENNSAYIRPWKRDERNHSLDWRIILSIWGQKLHDNPRKIYRRGTVFNGDRWQLGYMGLGALLLGYTKWLIEKSIKDKVDTLYFLARDGKIMKEAYDALSPLYKDAPKSVYMLCSRRSINLAKVKKRTDILDLLYVDFAHRVSLGHLLENRFGLTYMAIDQDILKKYGLTWQSRITKDDLPRLRQLMIELENNVMEVASSERENYLDYLRSIGIMDENEKSAIVDIGYAGTMQQSLFQLLNKKISGYYLITFRKAIERLKKNSLNSTAFLAEFVDRHDTYHPFCRYVPLYETLFSSTDCSFIKMSKTWDGKLQPIFMQETDMENERIGFVRMVHKGALEFISDCVDILGQELKKIDVEQNKTLRLLDQLFSDPHPRDARLFAGVSFEDAYGGNSQRIILSENVEKDGVGIWRKAVEILSQQESKEHTKENVIKKDGANSYSLSSSHQDKSVLQHCIYYFITKFAPENKKQKFLKNPQLFFHDSKSTIIKFLGKKYLKD